MSALFFTAAAGLATFLYFSLQKTPYLGPGAQTDNPLKDRTTFTSHYSDPKDTWCDPTTLTTDTSKIRLLKQEAGPYGIPRSYWTGPGNSKLVNYGDLYTAI